MPQLGYNGPFNFGNMVEGGDTLGRIEGCKWEDRDCDSYWDAHEPALAGWQIELYQTPGWVFVAQTTTDANGCYLFDNLPAGDYRVKEVNQFGWWQTYPTTVFHTITLQQGEWLLYTPRSSRKEK